MQTIALAVMQKSITKATIQDIARELNITASAVSRALHDHAAISDATKTAVRKAAWKLKHHPNKIASLLQLGKSRISSVFTVEYFTSMGTMQAIEAAGRKIPDTIALIRFANGSLGGFVSLSVSIVDQQANKIGEEAANLFFSLSEKDNFYESSPQKFLLETAVLCRGSSLRKR